MDIRIDVPLTFYLLTISRPFSLVILSTNCIVRKKNSHHSQRRFLSAGEFLSQIVFLLLLVIAKEKNSEKNSFETKASNFSGSQILHETNL